VSHFFLKLEADGKPIGEFVRQRTHVRTHARTDGRTTRKLNASGLIYRMGGGIITVNNNQQPPFYGHHTGQPTLARTSS